MMPAPTSLEEYRTEVAEFAKLALAEIKARCVAGETNFSIERRFDRSNIIGDSIDLSWFQLVFLDYVLPLVEDIGGIAYADFYPEDPDIVIYRISLNEERTQAN